MNDKEIYRLHAEFCKVMGNPKRIEIMFLLGNEELCVDEIADKMKVRVANISQHLSVMREKGVVVTRREGTKIYYKIANPKTLQACIIMRDAMVEHMKKNINLINEI
jgi:ArsR family transcriptional regulator